MSQKLNNLTDTEDMNCDTCLDKLNETYKLNTCGQCNKTRCSNIKCSNTKREYADGEICWITSWQIVKNAYIKPTQLYECNDCKEHLCYDCIDNYPCDTCDKYYCNNCNGEDGFLEGSLMWWGVRQRSERICCKCIDFEDIRVCDMSHHCMNDELESGATCNTCSTSVCESCAECWKYKNKISYCDTCYYSSDNDS